MYATQFCSFSKKDLSRLKKERKERIEECKPQLKTLLLLHPKLLIWQDLALPEKRYVTTSSKFIPTTGLNQKANPSAIIPKKLTEL